MTISHSLLDGAVSIHVGDCLSSLRQMPDKSVHCCVTSPPYFGLRDYGVDGQIGVEETPAEFIASLVAVFREVRRVLRDDGTLWLNMGDSYARGRNGRADAGRMSSDPATWKDSNPRENNERKPPKGVHAKQLLGIPWRVAFALQDDGWYLRQDIIWSKPNPMPESVKDRCTKAHEYLFLLSKSPRYFFDGNAIKEPAAESSISRWAQNVDGQIGSDRVPGKTNGTMKAVGGPHRARDTFARSSAVADHVLPGQNAAQHRADRQGPEHDLMTRNRRSVWSVATRPFKGAHFATFPPELIEPCILAGCPVGGIVLDPFGGSGTTGGVAVKHGRNSVLCELNPESVGLMEGRISSIAVASRAKRKAAKKSAVDTSAQSDMFAKAECA